MVLFGDMQSAQKCNHAKPHRRLVKALILVLFASSVSVAVLPPVPVEAAQKNASERMRKLTPAALRGDRQALRDLAKAIVKNGPSEFKNAAAIRMLLRSEAGRGSTAAANAYGQMLQNGIGGPAKPAEAAQWYAKGSAKGNISASKNGALAYALGWGVRRDTRRAMRLLTAVPVEQRVRKMLEISKELLKPGQEEPDLAMAWLQKAVALYGGGSVDPSQIGRRIAELDAASQGQMRAWLEPLAAKRNGAAAMMLAAYLSASDKPEDRAAAIALYLIAAEQNIDGAYKALGSLIASSSTEKAAPILAMLEAKARSGMTPARIALANYYMFQSAQVQDLRKKSMFYLEQAAQTGDIDAQYKLAIMLLSSVETATEQAGDQKRRAQAYLVLSARGGNRMAEIAVARFGSLPLSQARQIVAVQIQ
jgi:TPR repeat protein